MGRPTVQAAKVAARFHQGHLRANVTGWPSCRASRDPVDGAQNGKTALIACLALAHLVGPEAIDNGEIYSAANDRDQAGIIFKFAKQIIELTPSSRRR